MPGWLKWRKNVWEECLVKAITMSELAVSW